MKYLQKAEEKSRSIRCATICILIFSTIGTVAVSDAADRDADNTKRNESNPTSLTPLDQPNNQSDINTAAAVRNAIVNTDGLSTNAKNIKIIASQGTVTMLGPVESENEKAKLEMIVKNVTGVSRISNQLTAKNY